MKTLIIQFILLSVLSSCGTDKTSFDSLKSALANERLALQILNDDDQNAIAKIKIKESSKKIEWKAEYTKTLSDLLSHPDFFKLYGTPINDEDLKLVGCTNFNSLSFIKMKVFYIVYLAAIAEAESDFRVELKTKNPGDNTTNVGLFQIDEKAANAHASKYLGHIDEEDLANPKINLEVGAYILKNQIGGKIATGRLFPSKSYYWQALTKKERVLKNINLNRAIIPFCQKDENASK